MAEMNTQDFLASVLLELASTAAQSAAYPQWTDDFSRKEVREVWSDQQAPLRKQRDRRVTVAQLREISKEQLRFLGFRTWDDSGLQLIPLWAFNYIADGEVLCCIDKAELRKGIDNIDLDVRGGCIAFGFLLQPAATGTTEQG